MTGRWRPPLILVLAGGLSGTLALSFVGIVTLRYLGPEIGFRNAVILLGLTITFATAILGWLLLRLLLRPIIALENYAESIRFDSAQNIIPPMHFGTRELHRTSKNIIEMADTLRDREATIRSFTDHVTHEIKTPVSVIKAAVELLEDGENLGAENRKIIRQIDEAQAQIQTQLDALRKAAQARETRYLGTSTLNDMRPKMVAAFPNLTLDFTGAPISIPLSHDGMGIVLQQLLQNSVEHHATDVHIHVERLPHEVFVDIVDNGTGISAGNVGRVFDAFFTTKRESGGTGMGLAIANNILAAHHGKITCLPTKIGAHFRVTFAH